MLPTHFDEVDGDLYDQCTKNVWIVQNSDNDLLTICLFRILISITPSLLLYFMLGS